MRFARTLLIVLVATGCATNPATGRRQVILMSEAEEIQLGKQADAEVRKQMGLYEDAELQRYVRDVGDRLVRAAHRPNLPWSFAVVDEPAVNAFALPGGYIYLTRGIMPFLRDEAELAAVLGHEIGHVDARHQAAAYSRQTLAGGGLAVLGILVPETQPLQGVAQVAFGMLFLKHGREDELESDRLGVTYAAASGWDPEGMKGLLSTLARLDEASGSRRGVPNWALTHPPAADRAVKVEEAVTTAPDPRHRAEPARAGQGARRHRLRRQPREGHRARQRVLPSGAWLRLAVPAGLGDRQHERAGRGTRERREQRRHRAPARARRRDRSSRRRGSGWRRRGFGKPPANARISTVNPPTSASMTVRSTTRRVRVRAAHIQSGGQVYLVAGIAPASQFGRADSLFEASISSFRPLARAEAERVQPNRIDFHTVRGGETWESIAKGPGGGAVRASTLAIMNGRDVTTQPRSGERIRIVVSGM